ncbi:MAG: sulfatase-like hydrolase/transferase, partial [Acidobacteriota bacterium]
LTTLAEYLQAQGFRTVGFSATPNDSASRNMDQGFDEFHELWGSDNPNHGPFNLSRLAGDVLESQPSGDPLYLQLHYLPPHQPYAPGRDFDRFTDPSYSGPIEPRMGLKQFSLGRESLAPADLEELIGLYDGNLLRADAAVGELLNSLKEVGRFDNSIIILTSDHGEAFMEHGYQGHNTTLFDEMLHVPLVIRLPFGRQSTSLWLDRPTSLLDVVPTVLGALDIDPVSSVDGCNLFNSASAKPFGRVLLARTSHAEQPMISVRSEFWKSIAWPKHQVQMLFDIVDDPDERENRIGEVPWMFANLGLIARERLLRAQARGYRQGDEVLLDRETEEALRALGYLD